MAHKKASGTTQNVHDSNPQYRGVKMYGGQHAEPGNVLVRQCGTKIRPGVNVGRGSDDTLFATEEGVVTYTVRSGGRKFVSVVPEEI